MEPATTKKIAEVAVRALHGTEKIVRIGTVDALGRFGTQDMSSALKVVAETDPSPGFEVIRFESQPPSCGGHHR